jgi:hypothetical protein
MQYPCVLITPIVAGQRGVCPIITVIVFIKKLHNFEADRYKIERGKNAKSYATRETY